MCEQGRDRAHVPPDRRYSEEPNGIQGRRQTGEGRYSSMKVKKGVGDTIKQNESHRV
jgi:hypothetical protein